MHYYLLQLVSGVKSPQSAGGTTDFSTRAFSPGAPQTLTKHPSAPETTYAWEHACAGLRKLA